MLARNVDIMGLTVTKIGDYFTVVANCCSSCVDKEARSPELFEIDIFFESHFCKLRVILRSRVLLLRIVYDFMEDIDRLAAPLDDSAQGQQDDCTEQAVLRRCIISRRGNLFNYSRKASSFIYHVSYWLCEQQSGLHYCADRSASSPTVASF